jgi:hypothetical protein
MTTGDGNCSRTSPAGSAAQAAEAVTPCWNSWHEGAPDDVVAAIGRLPAGRKFHTIGEIVRTLGIHTEEDDPGHTAT